MKTILSIPIFLFLILQNICAQDIVLGRIILKATANQDISSFEQHLLNDNYLRQIKDFRVFKKFPNHKPIEPTKLNENLIDLSLIYEINFDTTYPTYKILNYLNNNYRLQYAEPVFKRYFFYTPTDPSLTLQYHLSLINALQAYNITQGDTNVVIGISDTGVDLAHPDLKDNIKKNYDDPIDGIDNDFDGYIDNFTGWDLALSDNNPQFDVHPHGVHVAGISSATTDNNIGITGVGFKCKFLPLKIMDNNGNIATGYESIVYAADHGCSIVNCSWGGLGYSQYEQDIVNYATFNQNCLVVAAAGNNNTTHLFYPASYKNVLSVTATNNTDAKWSGSSFNEFVSVSAPGQDIYSTLGNGTYGYSSGTSMAAPVASGVAALIKSKYPQFTPIQIIEQLKATADFIDTVNSPLYSKKIGVGRINAYRALTEQKPGIRYINFSITDGNDEVFGIGDTLKLSASFNNVLSDASGALIMLTSTSPYISILNPVYTVGSWPSGSIKSNSSNPFKIYIKNNVPFNHTITFLFEYFATNYRSYEAINVIVNEDILNITVNELKSSISSRGYIGFNNPFQTQGLGVKYKNENLLYLGSLVLGNATTQVSDNLPSDQPNSYNQDFYSLSRAVRLYQSPISNFDTYVSYNDQNAGAGRLNVTIIQKNYAWSDSLLKKTHYYHYQVINNGITPLGSLYAALYTDWDIKSPILNKANYLPSQKIMYAYSSQPNSPYIGVQLLNHHSKVSYYALDLINDPHVNLADGFSKEEKYTLLTLSNQQAGNGAGSDIATLMGAGPFFLNPSDTLNLYFALIAADSLNELIQSATYSQQQYNQLFVGNNQELTNKNTALAVYPNPAKNKSYIHIPADGQLTIYNNNGQKIFFKTILSSINYYLLDLSDFAPGIYYLQFTTITNTVKLQTKLVVLPK